jgi:CubicO group peptidase (beta-lactamase class C family)
MEKASGREFLDLINEEVLLPLKLSNTSPDKNDSIIYNRTGFYEVKNGNWVNAPYVDNSYKWAGGGFISTSEDIAKFGDALLRDDFLKKETIDLFTTAQKLNDGSVTTYGMGFGSNKDYAGKFYFGHSGGSVGGTCDMVIYPESKIVVVVLTNLSDVRLSNIAKRIANFMIEK